MAIPHEYIRDLTFVTASAFRIFSPVIGQVPLFASVAAMTELLWQFISREFSYSILKADFLNIQKIAINKS